MARLPATLRALSSRSGMRRALAAYALNSLVEMAIWLAIILYAFDKGGAQLAGLVAVVQLLPAAALAPFLSGIGDRMARGTALVVAYSAVAAATLLTTVALLVEAPVPVVITASALATISLSMVSPIHFAALPQLADTPDQLVSGNALSSVATGVALFLGPVLAGFGAEAAGPWLVFTGASVLGVLAALLCLRLGLPAPSDEAMDDEPEGWRTAFEGIRALWRNWAAIALLLVMGARFVVAGGLDLLGVEYSEAVLDLGQSGAGLILGALGIGSLIGAFVAGSVGSRRRLTPVIGLGGVIEGVTVAAVALVTVLAPAMGLLIIAGMGATVMLVSGRTLLQRSSDDRVMARVFAVQEAVSLLGLALGAILAPVLIDLLSPAGAFVPFGIGAALLTVAGLLLIRRLDERAVYLPREMELLRSVSFLSVLPPYELERLARNARWVDASIGDVVVRQGEPGELFYVIDRGEFSVSVDGIRRPTTLGAGDGFGEVALLQSVPRTATVTAVTAGRLLTLTADVFLAAVTGSVDGHAIAHDVAAAHVARDE